LVEFFAGTPAGGLAGLRAGFLCCLQKEGTMKYLVPPIVIPVLLFIGIAAYGILRAPIIVDHPSAPAANAQPR
jgi:hypothetical protein